MHGSQTENVHMKALIRVKKPSVLFRSVRWYWAVNQSWRWGVLEKMLYQQISCYWENLLQPRKQSNSIINRERARGGETAFITTDQLCLTHTHGSVCVCNDDPLSVWTDPAYTHTHTHSRERLSSIIVCVRVFYRLLVSRLSLLLESHRTNLQEHRELLIYHLQSCSSASERWQITLRERERESCFCLHH